MTSPLVSSPSPPDLLPIVREAASGLTSHELAAPILVGVSGGPDSLALLHLLWRWSRTGGPAIRVVQVDHALRPESAAEAGEVAALCATWGVPISLRTVAASAIAERRGGLEEAARRERYRLFAEEAANCGARVLALGHQADDQAETVLLHLLRGAGLAGLAALPVVRRSGDLLDAVALPTGTSRPAVWRPLLTVRRAAIEAYCRAQGLTPFHDPSNDDAALRRNALRRVILPQIEQSFPGASAALARSAAILADDEAVLQGMTEEAWGRCARADGELVWLDRASFRTEAVGVQRRLIRRAWSAVGAQAAITGLSMATVEAAREGLLGGQTGGRFALPGGVTLLLERGEAVCGPTAGLEATLRRRIPLPQGVPGWSTACLPGETDLGGGWRVVVQESSGVAASTFVLHIPFSRGEASSPLVWRTWQPGDRVALGKVSGMQKLHDCFVNRHVPGYLRRHLVVLAQGSRVYWVVGLVSFPLAVQSRYPHDAGYDLRLLYNGAVVDSTGFWAARDAAHDAG